MLLTEARPYFDRHARSALAVGIELEQAQRRVLVAQRRPAHIEHIVHARQIDRSVHAQLRNRARRQRPIQCYVNGARSVHYGGINAGHVAWNDAVVGIN